MMNKLKKWAAIILATMLLLSGCSKEVDQPVNVTDPGTENVTTETEDVSEPEEEEPETVIEKDIPSLAETYADYFTVGVAVPMSAFGDDNAMALIKKHFNSITAENAMKPDSMMNAGKKGAVNFITADLYTAYAKELGVGLRGHTLVWHSQTPSWFFREDFGNTSPLTTKEEMLSRMENHIKEIMERYDDDTIYCWDVVNEVIDPETADGYRESAWYDICGPEFVEKAFEYARKYSEGKDIKLFYNDYSIVADKKKRMLIYEMVKPLAEKGLIDGVGLQSHINVYGPSAQEFADTIELFGSLGLEVQLTELDISMYSDLDTFYSEPPEALLIKQAYLYKEIFEVCKEHSDIVTNITIWALTDNGSWLNTWPITRTNWPVLFDNGYQGKLALQGLLGEPLPEPIELTDMSGSENVDRKEAIAAVGTVEIDGEKEAVWDLAHPISVDTFTQNSNGALGTVYTLYDDQYLYVLAEIKDTLLQAESSNPWEQDSLEVFLDENMSRSVTYDEDDVQYRININNEVTINGGFTDIVPQTVTVKTEDGYRIEMAIPFNQTEKQSGDMMGFDIQINDDQGSGSRDSTTNWSDLSGNGWQSSSDYGVLVLE